MVVRQTRLIFDLADIATLRFECNHCGREAVQPVGATEVPNRRPFCHEDWEVDNPDQLRESNYQLVRAMQTVLAADTPLVTIRCEIKDTAAPQR